MLPHNTYIILEGDDSKDAVALAYGALLHRSRQLSQRPTMQLMGVEHTIPGQMEVSCLDE